MSTDGDDYYEWSDDEMYKRRVDPEIRPSIFRDLANLKHLIITKDRQLKWITRDTFKSLVNIETINLSANQIEEIDPEAFTSLKKLTSLNLSKQRIKKFALTFVPDCLEHLDLSDNLLDSIEDTDSAEGLPVFKKLLTLDLSDNEIESLTSKAFSNLLALRSLNLGLNRELTDLPEDLFSGLCNLRELDLTMTSVRVIQANLLASTPNLNKLVLNLTRVELIENGAFSHLRCLSLRIDVNQQEPYDWFVEQLKGEQRVDIVLDKEKIRDLKW